MPPKKGTRGTANAEPVQPRRSARLKKTVDDPEAHIPPGDKATAQVDASNARKKDVEDRSSPAKRARKTQKAQAGEASIAIRPKTTVGAEKQAPDPSKEVITSTSHFVDNTNNAEDTSHIDDVVVNSQPGSSKASSSAAPTQTGYRNKTKDEPAGPSTSKPFVLQSNDDPFAPQASSSRATGWESSDDETEGRPHQRERAKHDALLKERRKLPFRSVPPEGFKNRLDRAISQPMAILSRLRDQRSLHEAVEVQGTDGHEKYRVHIERIPRCNCADHCTRKHICFCKHILYVLHFALKIPLTSHLLYQLAFLPKELQSFLTPATAPPRRIIDFSSIANPAPVRAPVRTRRPDTFVVPGMRAVRIGERNTNTTSSTYTVSAQTKEKVAVPRKKVEGDCPICYSPFTKRQKVVWCKAGCGNNVHAKCQKVWVKSAPGRDGRGSCAYCRSAWCEGGSEEGVGGGNDRGVEEEHEGQKNEVEVEDDGNEEAEEDGNTSDGTSAWGERPVYDVEVDTV
ncbi:hypothetical protein M011DRAFT_481721 [Sporormia fimetaria CBS 119925]|uniref:SWIM-type domain-containing protein n=1 Tax=Sporormia fimetaria CBS 119925 TaxID=1340428 RepID=A0A6A6UYF1_9PLEO|nr:hypothetical protein M011DRAFT_481721 [Sporormia fimetaria CBS 119925]